MPYFDLEPVLGACPQSAGLRSTLYRNLGKVCTVHVDGEATPLGVTGVLSDVSTYSCKLISLEDYPASRRCGCEDARRIHTIPLDKITYIDTTQY